jgi:hypothetical protein
LDITEIDPGNVGEVAKSPDKDRYQSGETVTLTASVTSGDQCDSFESWGGDASGTDAQVTVTMTKSLNVTATFYDGTWVEGGCCGAGACEMALAGMAILLLFRPARRRLGARPTRWSGRR